MALFTGMTMAQAGANNVEQAKAEKAKNDKGKEHHSSLAKAAFWRRHKDAGKNAKRAQTTQTLSKQAQAKTAQVKPVSAKQASGKKDQKQEQHVSNVSKPSTKTEIGRASCRERV